jgi:mannose-6-phosphate isomerase-like protein (cupin superfamily)
MLNSSPLTVPGARLTSRTRRRDRKAHWTDEPYVWHVNDGTEVFVVLHGAVDMHYRVGGREGIQRLTPGQVCVAEPGDEHVAYTRPGARILVVEKRGSV